MERYMAVLYKEKATKWVCRFYFNSSKKYISIMDDNKKEIKYHIENIYDIESHTEKLISVIKRFEHVC